ncbi:branched-chain amino acid ABC transporter permease [Nonomuraea endophytica]|uniref:Branched-subunit amino acid ABC-type transport system permease component n=1 Tax=Nonomuraea endophytica TaxID=714136 RepID=A0A7W8AAU7_9ACTN|nr:branched-chain amino acid ABC transporter permease [Nonomuraea endophytica]MBB5082784.1 branched-subunit amino acid ABC-type transport system permease component [Nonomuraea endophytica]
MSLLVNAFDGLAFGALLFVLAVGLTLIYGMLDVLNLAHGALYMAGGYIAYLLLGGASVSLGLWAGAALLVAALGVALGGVLSAAILPLRGRGHLDQALLTLGLAILLSEFLLGVVDRGFHTLPPPDGLDGSVLGSYPLYRVAVIAAGLVIGGIVYWIFERTRAGALVRAAVDDPGMLAAIGVNVARVRLSVMLAGCGLATFAGVLGLPLLNLRAGLDSEVLVLALIVIVIGGLASIRGAVVGALLVGQVQTVGVALAPELAAYLLFAVMAAVLLWNPSGMFGRAR